TRGLGGDDGAAAPPISTPEGWTYDIKTRTIRRGRSFELRRPRFMGDSILLPDGNIALVGGASTGYTNRNSNRVLNAELIQPSPGSSADTAAAMDPRGYHASALLLPNASVFVTGGTGRWANEDLGLASYPPEEHKTVEIFEPPYLSTSPRPQI